MAPVLEICAVPRQPPVGSDSLTLNVPLQNGEVTPPTSGKVSIFLSIAWMVAWCVTTVPLEV